IVLPPLAGATNTTEIWPSPRVTVGCAGAAGVVAGTVDADASDSRLLPRRWWRGPCTYTCWRWSAWTRRSVTSFPSSIPTRRRRRRRGALGRITLAIRRVNGARIGAAVRESRDDQRRGGAAQRSGRAAVARRAGRSKAGDRAAIVALRYERRRDLRVAARDCG